MGCDLQRYQRRASHLRAGRAPAATLPPVTVPGGTDAGGRPVTGTRRGSALQSDDPRRLGPFALSARLGSGGMGVVYLARHDAGHEAAVKVVHPHLVGDPDFGVRFAREIAVARSVDAPWTARVLDADPHGERPWLATEFVDGPALDEQVARAGGLPRSALEILGRRLAEALAGLHAGGVVHRDLKPSNVLLGTDGPRLIDFGIARSIDATKITHTGLVMGTPAYMAPEQAEGEDAGPPADVFSLASVLFFAATGAGPFGTASHPAAMLLRILQRTPDTSALPAPLDEWLRPCFARDPAERPTAGQLVTAWTPTPTLVDVAGRPQATPALGAPPEQDRRVPRLLSQARAVLAVLVAVAMAAAFFWVPTTSVDPATRPAPAAVPVWPAIEKLAEIDLSAPVKAVEALAWPRIAAVSEDGVQIVDVEARTASPVLPLPDRSSVTASADGARLYVAGYGLTTVDVATGTVGPVHGDRTYIWHDIAVDPDGRRGYVSYRGRTGVDVVDLADGQVIDTIPTTLSAAVLTLVGGGQDLVVSGHYDVLTTDPKIIAEDGNDATIVFDTLIKRPVRRIPGRAYPVLAAGDGRDANLIIDSTTLRRYSSRDRSVGEARSLLSVVFRAGAPPQGDAIVVDGGKLGEFYVMDSSGLPRQDLSAIVGSPAAVAFSRDGGRLYAVDSARRQVVQVLDSSGLDR